MAKIAFVFMILPCIWFFYVFTTGNKDFTDCTTLKSISFGDIDTSNVTNMSNMFNKCENVEQIDVSSFSTQNVVDMSSVEEINDMFNEDNAALMSGNNLKTIKTPRNIKLDIKLPYTEVEGIVNVFPLVGQIFVDANNPSMEYKYLPKNNSNSITLVRKAQPAPSSSSGSQPSSNPQPSKTDKGVSMYRLYNPNVGDHHYTSNPAEINMIVAASWKDEGYGWYALR